MYLPVTVSNIRAMPPLDSGSTLNVMSQSMLQAIRQRTDVNLQPTQLPEMTKTNNQNVQIIGNVKVKVGSRFGARRVLFHVLPHASHPLLLRTKFLSTQHITLDFRIQSVKSLNSKLEPESSACTSQQQICYVGQTTRKNLDGYSGPLHG